MKPILSIVLPTFNRGGTLLKPALNSILSQDFSDFELIIVDDLSTDKTSDVIAAYQDPRIRFFRNSANRGEYWSTNFGINQAQGQYLTWVHSDDLLPDKSLTNRINIIKSNPSLDFVHGDIAKIDMSDKQMTVITATSKNDLSVLSEYLDHLKNGKMVYLIHHLTIMMKLDFYKKTGPFDTTLPFAGDIDWLVRAIKIGSYVNIPKILYYYRTHSQTRRIMDVKNGVDKIAVHKLIASRYL